MSEHARPYDVAKGNPNPLAEVNLTCSCGAALRIEGANRLYPSSVEYPVKQFLRRHRKHQRRSPTAMERVLDSFDQPMWTHETRTETRQAEKDNLTKPGDA